MAREALRLLASSMVANTVGECGEPSGDSERSRGEAHDALAKPPRPLVIPWRGELGCSGECM